MANKVQEIYYYNVSLLSPSYRLIVGSMSEIVLAEEVLVVGSNIATVRANGTVEAPEQG